MLIKQYAITVITAINSIILARLLSIDARGELAEVLLYFAWITLLISFAFPHTIQFNNFSLKKNLIRNVFILKTTLIIAFIISVVFYKYTNNGVFLLFPIYYILFYSIESMQKWLYSRGHISLYWNHQLIFLIFNLLLNALLLFFIPSVWIVILNLIIAYIIFFYLNYTEILEQNEGESYLAKYNIKYFYVLIKQNLKNYIYFILKSLVGSIDKFVILFFFSVTELGVYVVLLFIQNLYTPLINYFIVKYTYIIKDNKDIGEYKKIRKIILQNLILIVLPLMLVGALFSDDIVYFFFGEKYLGHRILINLIIINTFIMIFFQLFIEYLMLMGKAKVVNLVYLAYTLIFLFTLFSFTYFELGLEAIPLASSSTYLILILGIYYLGIIDKDRDAI